MAYWAARDFDKTFLNQLSMNEWKEIIAVFNLPCPIVYSIKLFEIPALIYNIDGKIILIN